MKLEVIGKHPVKALDFKPNHLYSYIRLDNGVSEVGYVRVEIEEGKRTYWYKGVLTGMVEKCHPANQSKFYEVKLCHT
jgi:hypothetical protein